MRWNNVKITIFKEIRGIVRDKKSLRRILLLPLLIPAVILLFGLLFDVMEKSQYTVGINYTLTAEEKNIVKEMDNLEFIEYQSEEELKEAYQKEEISGYVVKEGNQYTIYSDLTVNSGEMIQSYVSAYLNSYSQVLASNYLIEQGVDVDKVFNNVVIDYKSLTEQNEGEEDSSNSLFTIILSLVVTYVLMIVVMTCIVVATDATSGEKERGTLETILTFPVRSSELVAGKYLATAILGCIVGLVSYAFTIPSILIGKNMFSAYENITINVNVTSTILVICLIILSSLLVAGVCLALAGKAKTYKEAQSSLQFISFLPMLPYFLKVAEVDNSFFSLIPIANCGMALNDITMNHIDSKSLFIILISTVIYTVLIIMFISKQYKSEKTLFS